MEVRGKRILVVDDDEEMSHALARAVESWGYACEVAASGETALEVLQSGHVDLVICDVFMGDGMSGFDLLGRVRALPQEIPVILVTGFASVPAAVDAIKRGAYEYLTKPYDLDQVHALVERATSERPHSERKPAAHDSARVPAAAAATDLIGRSAAMARLLERIDLVASSLSPVLVLGESGSGKELVARAIHAAGARKSKPFVAVNAAAIPEQLLESEVFGHVRGAFTGATQTRRGLLAEADGGTILLDEIGDMPIGLQPKLLRFLQLGEVRPVGGDTVRKVDVRVIAATHRDLPVLISEGRFREDLYYRLNVVPVSVPPLRERREDVPLLVEHFLGQSLERTPTSPVRSISDEAMQVLMDAPWPGNVRELASVIERLVVLGREEIVRASDVAFAPTTMRATPLPDAKRDMWTLKRLSDSYVSWVLEQTNGNKAQAAKILGVDLSTLYRWHRARRD